MDKKRTVFIVSVVLVLVITIGSFLLLRKPNFYLDRTFPKSSTTVNETPQEITFTFTKKLLGANTSIITAPNFDYTVRFDDKKMIITPKDFLRNNTNYTIGINNIPSQTGEIVEGVAINFDIKDTTPFRKALSALPIYKSDYALLAPKDPKVKKFRLRLYEKSESAKNNGYAAAKELGIAPLDIVIDDY